MPRPQRERAMMALRMNSLASQTALVGIFAAFHVVVTIMPFSVALGTQGSISMGIVSAPIIGFLLGPYLGTIAVLIGAFLGITLNPTVAVMGLLTPIATSMGAFAAGALTTGREKFVLPVFIAGMIMYIASPIGLASLGFLWLHVITLALLSLYQVPLVSTRVRAAIEMPDNFLQQVGAVGLVAFMATMTNHIVGSTIAAFYFVYIGGSPAGPMAGIFLVIAFVYPLERAVATILITLITTSVLKAIQSGNLFKTTEQSSTENTQFRALDLEPYPGT
ncbi:MAG: hypothetical protein ACTSYL_01755 [Candidatus Thorarchaeota archaeon]